jgi:hypothetical protein
MKNILVFTVFLAVLTFSKACGQSNLLPLRKLDTLFISDVRTTHLLFGQDIAYVDIGSPYFVSDTLKQIVKLKHIGQDLTDSKSIVSNLTVITKDGGFYSMILEYDRFTDVMSYKVKKSEEYVPHLLQLDKTEEKEEQYAISLCDQIDLFERNVSIRNAKNEDLKIFVSGIFYIDEKIGVRLEINNKSAIDFDIDQILFRTKLKKRISPDYLYQERTILPIRTCTDNLEIPGNGNSTVTLLFDKFMPNKKEKIVIDIFEQNGGRSSTIFIPRRKLMKPKIVSKK